MRLTYIKCRGLKGGANEYAIAPAIFLNGRNAAGKTRLFDAIQLLVNGYHPYLPHKGDAIMRIADGDEIYVEGRFEGEHGAWTFARRWDRTETLKGEDKSAIKVSSKVMAFDSSGRKLEKAEAEAMIKMVAGEPYIIDIGELTKNKTDTERRDLLFKLGAHRSTWTPEIISEMLASGRVCPPVKPFDPAMSLDKWLYTEYAAAKERTSAARKLVDQRKEAAKKLGDDAGAVEPADVGVLRRAHDAAQQHSREVAAEWARSEEQAKNDHTAAITERETRRKAQADLDAARAEEQALLATPATDNSGEIKRLQDRIAELEDELDGIPAIKENLESVISQETEQINRERALAIALSRAEDATKQARAAFSLPNAPQSAELDALRSRCNTLSNFGQRIDGSLKEINAQIATLEGDGFDDPTCTLCGQRVTPEALSKFTDRRSELEAQVESIRQELVATQTEYDSALTVAKRQIANELNAALQQATENENEARQTHEGAKSVMKTLTARKNRLTAELDDMKSELLTTKERLRNLQTSSGTNEQASKLGTLRERIRKNEATLATTARDVDMLAQIVATTTAQATAAREKANTAASDAYTKLKAAEELLTLYREAAKIRQELADAEAALVEAKRVEAFLGPKGLMGKVVSEVLQPFADAVNDCIAGLELGTFEVRLQDARGNEVFHLGITRNNKFSPIETLCNGEEASVQAAILVGLASLANAPWKPVLADHMERLDLGRRSAFLSRLVALRNSGMVDQVMTAGCPDIRPDIAGLEIVPIGEMA